MPNQPNSTSSPRRFRKAIVSATSLAFVLAGCNVFPGGVMSAKNLTDSTGETAPGRVSLSGPAPSDRAVAKDARQQQQRVSNPQAREIRFDGQELVLGGGDCQSMQVDALRAIATDLRSRGRVRSATETVRLHRRSAVQWVLQSLVSPKDPTLRWVAATLDLNTGVALHTQLCDAAAAQPVAARAFDTARRQCLTLLSSGNSNGSSFSSLAESAGQLRSPLATLESERLLAMVEITSGHTVAAASRLSAAAQLAAQTGSADQSAQLWLLASEAHLRTEAIPKATVAWQNAVRAQLTAMTQQHRGQAALPPLDTVFWEQADRLRPPATEFPQEVALAMNPWKLRIGLGSNHPMKPSASLWAAVAACQLTMAQPHLATLSIKRAEVDASPQAKPWLRIALARSIAAQNQLPVATTILGSLTSHSDANVRAASLAALGSIKVQAGAYEQGQNFLVQSLTMQGATQWPGRLAAEADLANVRLIVGDIGAARESLHAVQQKLALQGRWQSLVHSLENEAAILELDGNTASVRQVRERIAELERQAI